MTRSLSASSRRGSATCRSISRTAALRTGSCPRRSDFKYNFIRDVDRQLLVSGGITYFIPGSQRRILRTSADGDFHFFLTGGKQIFDWGHWLSGTGFRIPGDQQLGHADVVLVEPVGLRAARPHLSAGRRELVSLDAKRRQQLHQRTLRGST